MSLHINLGTETLGGLLPATASVMNTSGNLSDKHFSTRKDTKDISPARYPCSHINSTNGYKKYKKRK
jgi:hypothetical protein